MVRVVLVVAATAAWAMPGLQSGGGRGGTESGEQADPPRVAPLGRPISAIATHPGGGLVAGADAEVVRLWSTRTGNLERALKGHSKKVNAIAFSPDGKLLASASDDGDVRLWDPKTGTRVEVLEHHVPVYAIAFSPDGKTLACANYGAEAILWDVWRGERTGGLFDPSNGMRSVAYSPDGRLIATGDVGGRVVVWDAAIAEVRERFDIGTPVTRLAFSPDGDALAAHDKLWEVATWRPQKGWNTVFSPDGRCFLSLDDQHRICCRDVRTRELIRTIDTGGVAIAPLAVVAKERVVVTGTTRGGIGLWRLPEP